MLALYYDVDSAPNFQLRSLMGYEHRSTRPDRKRNLQEDFDQAAYVLTKESSSLAFLKTKNFTCL